MQNRALPSLKEYFKGFDSNFLTRKNIISILLVGIGILSIPVAVDLVQQQQSLKSSAQQTEPANCQAFKISKPTFTQKCSACIAKQRPGIIDSLKQQHPYAASCSTEALMHLWCNGVSGQNQGQPFCLGVKGEGQPAGGGPCIQGRDSYNTSASASRQCTDTMSGVCYEDCKETIYDPGIGTCNAVAEGFPAQPLEPFKSYEFDFCRTHWTDSLPQEHTSFRRDSALMSVINPAAPVGLCGQFTMRVRLDSGGPGLHSLQLATGDSALYEHVPGGQPIGQSNQQPNPANNVPRYTPRAVCTNIVYEVKGKETLLPEGQNKVGYNSCAYNIGGQQSDMGTECALCMEAKRPGLSGQIQNLNYNLFRACTIRELTNKWCSDINPTACSELKSECGNVCGGTGAPSVPVENQPDTLPAPQPTITCNSTNTKATASWGVVAGAKGYRVRLDKDPGNSIWLREDGTVGDGDFANESVTGTSMELNITANSPYKFWMSSFNDRVANSPASENITFSCPAGVTANPVPGATTTSPGAAAASGAPATPVGLRAFCLSTSQARLRWYRVEGASKYQVTIGNSTVDVNNPTDPYQRPSYDLSTTVGQRYSWSVKAVNNIGSSAPATGGEINCP